MHSTDYAVARFLSVCPSVCLSHTSIVSNLINISSYCLHRRVVTPFSTPNVMAILRREEFEDKWYFRRYLTLSISDEMLVKNLRTSGILG